MLDIIERYNTDLDIWIALDVRSPVKIASAMACVVDQKFICVFGGVIQKCVIDDAGGKDINGN